MSRQSTLNVSLTPRLRSYVRSRVTSGQYESASEVVRDSLRALQERERATAEFWAAARGKLAAARQQVAAGKMLDGQIAMDQILTELEADRPARRRKRAR